VSDSVYFIAVIPPDPIEKKITELKNEVAKRFGSSHALKAPPHITLHMPFKWKDKKLEKLKSVINQINGELEPFEVELKDFDFFEPRVVFVDVVPTVQLEKLQHDVILKCKRELLLDNANYKNRAFRPHMTIAFRDLKKSRFYEAQTYFKIMKFDVVFWSTQISLLKHDKKKWEVIEC
jgi:2'-5' RNA ligase